jgi:hypothetical protein
MSFDSFVGSAYNAAASIQDNQITINWFLEYDKNDGAKTPKALLSAPGLLDLGQSDYSGEVRGMWVLKDVDKAIVVVGENALLMEPAPYVIGQRPTFTYSIIGTLETSAGIVGIRDNGAGNICVIVDGDNLYVYNVLTEVFTLSTDPGFLGSYVVCEIDGWFIFAEPDSQKFYVSPNYWDGTSQFEATFFALKDDAHDNIVTMVEQKRELWLIGEETTEIWYNQGGAYFPFARLQGTLQQIGCSAKFSAARITKGLVWLAKSERGNNQVVIYQDYQPLIVSTPAIEYQINQYPYVADAQAYVYNEEGHAFYVLTFPTANVTWVYDMISEEWHQRASYAPQTGALNRQRVNRIMNFQNMVIGGDYTNGQIYWQTRTVYADGDYPLVSIRRAPHLWDKDNRARIRYNRLQIEFKPGSASASGTYDNPQAILKWSDDGGQTFGNDHFAPIGLVGQTTNRCIWRRLGIARDRIFQVTVSDPVNRDITGASIIGEIFKT